MISLRKIFKQLISPSHWIDRFGANVMQIDNADSAGFAGHRHTGTIMKRAEDYGAIGLDPRDVDAVLRTMESGDGGNAPQNLDAIPFETLTQMVIDKIGSQNSRQPRFIAGDASPA